MVLLLVPSARQLAAEVRRVGAQGLASKSKLLALRCCLCVARATGGFGAVLGCLCAAGGAPHTKPHLPGGAGPVARSKTRPRRQVAAAHGVKNLPAVLLFVPGVAEPKSLSIPRKRDEFTEDYVVDFLQAALK